MRLAVDGGRHIPPAMPAGEFGDFAKLIENAKIKLALWPAHGHISMIVTNTSWVLAVNDRRRTVSGAGNTAVKTSTDSENRADRLRSEIAQLEARYDGLFPPGVYSVLESLRQTLKELQRV
jgi:hypothetical protein